MKKPKKEKTKKSSKKKAVKKKPNARASQKKVKKKSKGETTLENYLMNEFEMELEGVEVKDTTPYYVKFNSRALQYMFGNKGVAGGHLLELHAESGAGKSYLLYELGMVVTKQMGGFFLMFDVERAYKQKYGKRVGLHGNTHFQRSKEKTLETIFPVIRDYIKKVRKVFPDVPIMIGLDSYPPIQINLSKKELDNLDGNKDLKGYMKAKKNAIFSEFLGNFTTEMENKGVTFVVLNQTRMKMGVVFGDPMTTNADDIFQFYCTSRLRGRCGKKIKKGKRVIGIMPTWESRKMRDTDPFMKTTFKLTWKDGLDEWYGLTELLETQGVVKKVKGKGSKDSDGRQLYQYKKKSYLFNDENIEKAAKKYPSMLKHRD